MSKKYPFGPTMVRLCAAMGISDLAAASAIVHNIPKAEALAVKDADDLVRLILKAMTAHAEAAFKRNAEKGIVTPPVDAEADVNELYAAFEADAAERGAEVRVIDVSQIVPGTGTLQ